VATGEALDAAKISVMLEESAQSIGGVLFEAEITAAVLEQEDLSEKLADLEAKSKTQRSGAGTNGAANACVTASCGAVLGDDSKEQTQDMPVLLLTEQPSESWEQFAVQLAAAEAAQEALSAELATVEDTPSTLPGVLVFIEQTSCMCLMHEFFRVLIC
jgi:hypothetical protein